MHEPTIPNSPLHACWSQAGVWGRGDCGELAKVHHCRNCPVYSAAAALMLDGALPEGYLDATTAHYAAPPPDPARDTASILIFRIGPEWLALPLTALEEIVERRPLHSLPHAASPFLKGLVNVRGQLLLCLSLTKILQLPERSPTAKTAQTIFERLLVLTSEKGRLVFPVSEVAGLHRHRPAELREPPATVTRAGAHFTKAVLPWRYVRRDVPNREPEDVRVGVLDAAALLQAIHQSLA